jgi:Rrf2 family transcriptional regulator, cysteine metabolism repressor
VRISARGEYAIKAVLDLALHRDRDLVPIQEVAARQRIPQRYLEQVLLSLKRMGLLTSKRGSAGGYHLVRPPDEITVGEVLRAVEGNGSPFAATGTGRDEVDPDLAKLWEDVAEAVSGVVDRLTFDELAARTRARRSGVRAMYHI